MDDLRALESKRPARGDRVSVASSTAIGQKLPFAYFSFDPKRP